MQNLQRRASGIYVTRLTVPAHLRQIVGKREFIATTGTQHLAVAKLVASGMLATWRHQLLDLERLSLGNASMNNDSILRIADGHPLLAGDSYIPLELAATVLGLSVADLLRSASEGVLGIYHRFAGAPGYLVLVHELEVEYHDSERGTRVVPQANQMPDTALAHIANGVLGIRSDSVAEVANLLLVTGQCSIVMFAAPGADKARGFVPDDPVELTSRSVEASTVDLQRLRLHVAASIQPERVAAARNALKAALGVTPTAAGKYADRLFSEALAAYATKFLPQKISSIKEIERVRSGIALFSEFEGDLQLAEIDAERLRSFRDDKLSKTLAAENKVRLKYNTKSMSESMAATTVTGWPIMSAAERNLRMQWIARMFNWLHVQKWIADNPATGLSSESVENKSQRKLTALNKKVRVAFTAEDLQAIFSAPWFASGKGTLTKKVTYREFSPFLYWLPLLGAYAGGRINELCQLRLDDVRQTVNGNWYLDINENTADKSLKRQKDTSICWSKRKVPLHPAVVKLGFLDWCDRLRSEGFQRVFPELSWNAKTHYAKEPIRAMSQLFMKLGMPRDNTKVFHSFRHLFNNSFKLIPCSPEWRKRLMGHEPGPGVNEQHYLADPTPDESYGIISQIHYGLPHIADFEIDEGVRAVKDALRRKKAPNSGVESIGGGAPALP